MLAVRRAGPLSLWLRSGSQHREDVLSPNEAGSAPAILLRLDLGSQEGDIPRSPKGSSGDIQRSQGSGKRTTAEKRNFFFWRGFYLWVKNSRNAGRAGAFGGGPKNPTLLFTPNGFLLFGRSPNLKRRLRAGESGAPWRRGGSCSGRGDESAGREAGPGPARLRQAWLSGGSTRPVAVPWCNGEHSGL